MARKVLKQWEVPSDTDPDKTYTVTNWEDGWGCDCPKWKFARAPKPDCKHIEAVQDGEWDDKASLDIPIAPGQVAYTQIIDGYCLVPLIPINEYTTDILATAMYDMLQLGFSWQRVKEYWQHMWKEQPKKQAIISYIEHNGRFEYTDWVKERGWIGHRHVPV